MFVVSDLDGRRIGYLEGDRLRDDSGKPIGARRGSDHEALTLSAVAAQRMNGRKVMLDLGPADVVTPTTQFTAGIPRPDYIADRISPVRMVKHDRGTFFTENASDAIKIANANASAAGGEPSILEPGFTSTSFATTGYALAAKMPRPLLANADFDLKKMTLRRIVQALRLGRERRVASLLTTSANWNSNNLVTVAAGNKWNGGGGANPLADLMSARSVTYLAADVLIMSESVEQFFFVQPQASTGIRDYVQAKGQMPEVLTARAKIFSGGGVQYVWGQTLPTNVALIRVSEDIDELGTTLTCRWLGDSPDGQRVEGMLVREYDVPSEDSTYLVVAHNDAEVFVSNQVGALIVGALQ
jgi:hypothetical protein